MGLSHPPTVLKHLNALQRDQVRICHLKVLQVRRAGLVGVYNGHVRHGRGAITSLSFAHLLSLLLVLRGLRITDVQGHGLSRKNDRPVHGSHRILCISAVLKLHKPAATTLLHAPENLTLYDVSEVHKGVRQGLLIDVAWQLPHKQLCSAIARRGFQVCKLHLQRVFHVWKHAPLVQVLDGRKSRLPGGVCAEPASLAPLRHFAPEHDKVHYLTIGLHQLAQISLD
mmetsp:Transcript_4541/g.13757  ORF Transcript_4541/g.13757 Transcript_4541/m.13757 type:complete len:226 (+) Transcript_4541:400-1077(+)